MNKRLWIVIGILTIGIIVGAAIYAGVGSGNVNVDDLDGEKLITQEIINKAQGDNADENHIPDHHIGDVDSKVVVIMYEDFACSHCNQISGDVEMIIEDYKDKVLFIHRNFNLGYPNSQVTLQAAEAAYLTGGEDAYWQMNRLLFSTQLWISQAMPEGERKETLNGYAELIGLDVEKFNKNIDEKRKNGIQSKINRDTSLGRKAGVSGTPSIFVNGKKVDPSNTDIREAIINALKDAGISVDDIAPAITPADDDPVVDADDQ